MSDENVGGLVELLPCPFCGGDDLTTFNDGVWCEGCSAHHDIEDSDGGLSAAITAWNTRVSAHGQPVVDEAMVERAIKAFWPAWNEKRLRGDYRQPGAFALGMRAALTAAITGANP